MSNPERGNQAPSIRIRGRHVFDPNQHFEPKMATLIMTTLLMTTLLIKFMPADQIAPNSSLRTRSHQIHACGPDLFKFTPGDQKSKNPYLQRYKQSYKD